MINDRLIKICGMRDAENIRALEPLNVDMMGFIFYPPSPRYVSEMPEYMPKHAQRIGLFVNEEKKTIERYADRFGLNYIQLHGNESPEYCHSLRAAGLRVIKAFSVAQEKEIEETEAYEGACDYFLFDTKCLQYGGSGNQFDWSLLNHYTGQTPFLLSGGIHPLSAKSLKEIKHHRLAGFDLNSRFEVKPGEKDIERIKQFIDELR